MNSPFSILRMSAAFGFSALLMLNCVIAQEIPAPPKPSETPDIPAPASPATPKGLEVDSAPVKPATPSKKPVSKTKKAVPQQAPSATPSVSKQEPVPKPPTKTPQPDDDAVTPSTNKQQESTTSVATDPATDVTKARGTVFVDLDNDGKFGEGDAPFSGVRVSNGKEIVTTDKFGKYELPMDETGTIFVIKPNEFQSKLDGNKLPKFFYLHKPDGSPQLKFPGTKPTGPLPQSIDFPLYQQTESEAFKILLFGDPQPRNNKEVDYIAHDVIRDLIGKTDSAFGVTLGDIAFDNLETFEPLNQSIALIGIPWYNVIGNHDINLDAKTRDHSNETFEETYGPTYYSFDYGQVHFIVMDNIDFVGPNDRIKKMHYEPRFGERQLEFVKNDLAMISESQMVVLLMHVPIIGTEDKAKLFELIEDRPYCVSISGHTHDHRHLFLDAEDGFNGKKPHHHIINVTVSGSWWTGSKNENGIPHTTMKDGAPNGYSIMSFDDSGYRLDFRAAGRPADDQLRIEMPNKLDTQVTTKTDVWVNVYNGSEKSTVQMSIDGNPEWIKLDKTEAIDPYFQRLHTRDKNEDMPLSGPKLSSHLWKGTLPQMNPGVHLVVVETTDRHGRKYVAHRSLRVTGEMPEAEKAAEAK